MRKPRISILISTHPRQADAAYALADLCRRLGLIATALSITFAPQERNIHWNKHAHRSPMERNSFRPRGYRHASPLEQSRELLQWRRRWRRLAMMRCLFVRIGECEQMAFVPGTAKDRQARR
jgi:hypothetical protein